MACTTSIGPGALNLVTAAGVAHVNRLPVLFLPGDVFANRLPDPVLQQIEDFGDGTVSASNCFRPVSKYFDRIQRPEQLITALEGDFNPGEFKDEYRERVMELIEQKAQGKRPKLKPLRSRKPSSDALQSVLQASLRHIKERASA